MISFDEKYMRRCIELASLAKTQVAPNPMVGAVLVYENKIIAEGYHRYFGAAHAEIDCLNELKTDFRNKNQLSKATLYVNLEPCCHYGKTPPCTSKIIEYGIGNIVIGIEDVFPLVAKKGIRLLLDQNIKVKVGVLKEECEGLNKRFITYHTKKRPFVILKWAECLYGNMAQKNLQAVAISNDYTNFYSHQWRSEECAIFVGTHTALKDNPFLTTRFVEGKNPVRVVLDRHLIIPQGHHIFEPSSKVIIFNTLKNEIQNHLHYIKLNFEINLLQTILNVLYDHQILSVMIEGGAALLNSFIENDLWDEARIIKSQTCKIENGLKAPILSDYTLKLIKKIDTDIVYFVHPSNKKPD